MRITLKHLEYFVAAGEAGSIKMASKKINISQGSISSAVSHLEQELSLQLFVRHHAQGLTLTTSGKTMMRECGLLLRQFRDLYTVAAELKNEVQGDLSVGCMITLAPMIAPELGHTFMQFHDGVKLNIVEGSHEQLLDQLRQVKIDVAISYDLEVPADITYEPLAKLPPQVLLSKKHRLAKNKSIRIEELTEEPMIILGLQYSEQYFRSLFNAKNLKPNIVSRASSQEVVRTMVANGYGFSIANVRPKNLTALDGRKLVAIPLAGKHKPMQIGIATLSQQNKPGVLLAFEEHCRRLISNTSIPGMTPWQQ